MLNWLNQKLMAIKNWLKRKTKQVLIALGIVGVAVASTIALQPDAIPSVEINGERIEFTYTDNNDGEDLIIRANSDQIADVMYFMVENKSGIGQTINIQPLFSEKANIEFKISRLAKDNPYEVVIPEYGTTTYDCSYTATSTDKIVKQTCERQELVATSSETRYKDDWLPMEEKKFDQHGRNLLVSSKSISLKDTKGYEPKLAVERPILNKDIQYFKLEFTKREMFLKTADIFFLEAFGSLGGYGHLE